MPMLLCLRYGLGASSGRTQRLEEISKAYTEARRRCTGVRLFAQAQVLQILRSPGTQAFPDIASPGTIWSRAGARR